VALTLLGWVCGGDDRTHVGWTDEAAGGGRGRRRAAV